MEFETNLLYLAKVAAAFLAAFPAIALWSRTRDPAWMLVVLGALFLFVENLYMILLTLGVLSPNFLLIKGVSMIKLILSVIPYLFLAGGFLVFLFRDKRY